MCEIELREVTLNGFCKVDKIPDILALGIKPRLRWVKGDSTQKLVDKTEEQFGNNSKPRR